VATYAIPNTANTWIFLGTMNSLPQTGSVVLLNIFSNNAVKGDVVDELYATVRFSTSNGALFVRQGANSTPFYGEATIAQSLNWAATAAFAIQQNSSTSYSFYFNTGSTPGVGFFTVQSQSAFTYAGLTSTSGGPTGCFIYPTVLFQQGISSSGESTFVTDVIQAFSFQSQYNFFALQNAAQETLLYLDNAGSTLSTPLTCTGAFTCPDASLSIAKTSGLQGALDEKVPTASPSFTGTANAANLIASGFITAVGGFSCQFGSFSATNVFQNLLNVAGKRGFLFLDGQAPNTSSILAYFSCITPNPCLSIVAQNGNAYSFGNLGTAAGTGTVLMSVGIFFEYQQPPSQRKSERNDFLGRRVLLVR
jgi:hypothetical protein